MKTVFTHAYIQLDDCIDHDTEFVDLGAINLACEGREYAIDTIQSYWYKEDGEEHIEVKLAENREELDDCNYQLTDTDFHNSNLVADIYIDGEFSANIKHATLFVKQGEMNMAINLALA